MKKLLKIIFQRVTAGLVIIGIFGLTLPSQALASERWLDDRHLMEPTKFSNRTIWLVLKGNFDFSMLTINGQVNSESIGALDWDNLTSDRNFTISNGMIKTELPLFTFGSNVQYPGLLYNQNEEHLSRMLQGVTEEGEYSKPEKWKYVVGGALLVAASVYLTLDLTGYKHL